MLLIAFCLPGSGCAVFKKNTDPKAQTTGAGGTPPAKFPTSTDPIINGGTAAQVKPGAVLAGRVIDNYSKPPANTSIRLVSVDGKETTNAKDVDVMADGYFIIQGLKSGSNYKLLARGKNGDHVLAGITYTTAPNLTVVIQVKEDFANLGTPPVQGSPAFDDKKADKTSSLDDPRPFSGNSTVPTTAGARDGNDLHIPPVQVPVPGRVTSNAYEPRLGGRSQHCVREGKCLRSAPGHTQSHHQARTASLAHSATVIRVAAAGVGHFVPHRSSARRRPRALLRLGRQSAGKLRPQ